MNPLQALTHYYKGVHAAEAKRLIDLGRPKSTVLEFARDKGFAAELEKLLAPGIGKTAALSALAELRKIADSRAVGAGLGLLAGVAGTSAGARHDELLTHLGMPEEERRKRAVGRLGTVAGAGALGYVAAPVLEQAARAAYEEGADDAGRKAGKAFRTEVLSSLPEFVRRRL